MAANMNLSNQTYRSPLWRSQDAHPLGIPASIASLPWQQRYRPARPKCDNNRGAGSRNMPAGSRQPVAAGKGNNSSNKLGAGYSKPGHIPGAGSYTSTESDVTSIWRDQERLKLYKSTGDMTTVSTPPGTPMGDTRSASGPLSAASGDWGRVEEGDWSWVLEDGQDTEIEVLMGGAQTSSAPLPKERFDGYNWQEKVRQIYLQHDAQNMDLNVRRQRRATRARPWKDRRKATSPDSTQRMSTVNTFPVSQPEMLTSHLRINPARQPQNNQWAMNRQAYNNRAVANNAVGTNNSRTTNTPIRTTNTLIRTTDTPISTTNTPWGGSSMTSSWGQDSNKGTPATFGKVEKPFGSDTEDWLRKNEFSIWVKNKGRSPSSDNKKYIFRDKPRLGGQGADPGNPGSQYDHIGPHSDFYREYNQETIVAEDQKRATLVLQKFLRGYLQRHRFRRLRDRIVLKHAGTFKRFVREYKGLLTRIQKRHNVTKPKVPFILNDVSKFLDRKEKYEKTFYNMAICDKIPRNMLKRFFKECGHDPTDFMINEAYTNVFKGCGSKADIIFIVDCSASVGNNNFKLQSEFVKEFVTSLHVGEANIRVGYIPYNTDVYQSFNLDMYDEADSIIQGIDHVRYHKGLTRTDRALAKMREMFKDGRIDVPRIGVLITDGKSDSSQETQVQATAARKADKIQMIVVGVGKNTDMLELVVVAGSRGSVYLVPDYFSLWRVKTAIMKKCKLANCQYCHWVAPTDLQVDTTRGLCKEEALEIIWQMFPPRGTGITRQPREPHFIDAAEEIAYRKRTLRLVDEKEAYYSTSLSFAIKSKLDRNGFQRAPPAKVDNGESSWTDSVGAALLYVNKEKERSKAEQEEREKKEKKEKEKAARAEEQAKKFKTKGKGGKH